MCISITHIQIHTTYNKNQVQAVSYEVISRLSTNFFPQSFLQSRQVFILPELQIRVCGNFERRED